MIKALEDKHPLNQEGKAVLRELAVKNHLAKLQIFFFSVTFIIFELDNELFFPFTNSTMGLTLLRAHTWGKPGDRGTETQLQGLGKLRPELIWQRQDWKWNQLTSMGVLHMQHCQNRAHISKFF